MDAPANPAASGSTSEARASESRPPDPTGAPGGTGALDPLAALAAEARAAFAARLEPRRAADEPPTVLGAGSDDVEAGRAHLRALADGGWAVPTWPREYGGRGATPAEAAVIGRELAAFHVPELYPFAVGLLLVGPTMLAHGSPEQRARWLPRIASGAEIWCQMFSEPDAGSDLANLSTRAERDGKEWVLSGGKVWTSRAHYSQRGLLLARSDFTVPKHAGITAFGIDMAAAGVEIHPLRQMNDDAHFTQVFLDGVRVADTDRIGAPGEGWRVALTTLAHERVAGTAGSGSLLDIERLVALVRERGGLADPVVRDRLVRVWVAWRTMMLTARRARDTARAGQPGPEGSGLKLRGSALFRLYVDVAMQVLGATGVAGNAAAEWRTMFLTAPSLGIRGGTDEVQRNIVGERLLGLPAEPRVDRDLPFDSLPRSGRT